MPAFLFFRKDRLLIVGFLSALERPPTCKSSMNFVDFLQGNQRKSVSRLFGGGVREHAPFPDSAVRDARDPRPAQPTLRVGSGLIKSMSQQGMPGSARTAGSGQSRMLSSPKAGSRPPAAEPVMVRSPAGALDKARGTKYRSLPQGRGNMPYDFIFIRTIFIRTSLSYFFRNDNRGRCILDFC